MKALFLDRDGIINRDYGYVSKRDKFVFTEGIFEFLQLFISKGYTLFIVTNQSGIGRGYYSEDDFKVLTQWMIRSFREKDINIAEVYYCPHAPEQNCKCRKPSIGMITQALNTYPIDLESSWMIGDKESDIMLARNATIAHTIFIGEESHPNALFSFGSVAEAKIYFESNKEKIHG